jgi:hypothetical protein
MSLRIRRGTDAQRATTPLDLGELVYTTDTKQLYVGNGIDNGGNPIIRLGTGLAWADANCTTIIATGVALQVSADTNPTLGGNLILNNYNINGVGNINILGDVSVVNVVADKITNNVSSAQLKLGGLVANETNFYSITDGSSSGSSRIALATQRGTLAVPTSMFAGDVLGAWTAKGWDGTEYKVATSILSAWNTNATMSDTRPKSSLAVSVGAGGASFKITTFQYDGGLVLPGYIKVGSYTPASYPAGGSLTSIAGLVIGASGTFTCTSTTLSVGGIVSITGTNTGSGTVANGSYYIIATNGTTTFTLSDTRTGSAISTTAGTPVGLTVGLSLVQKGTIIFDSSDNHFYGFNGTSWVAFTGP